MIAPAARALQMLCDALPELPAVDDDALTRALSRVVVRAAVLAHFTSVPSAWRAFVDTTHMLHATRGGALFAPARLGDDDDLDARALHAVECAAVRDDAWRAVRDAVGTHALHPDTLAALTAPLHGLCVQRVGASLHVHNTSGQKDGGAFYTPQSLALPLARSTLRPWLHHDVTGLHALRICDPSIGAGAFLWAAVDVLCGQGAHARDVVVECVHGVDLDPLAVDLARLVLWARAGDGGLRLDTLDAHIVCGNALVGAWRSRVQGDAAAMDGWCAQFFGATTKIAQARAARRHRFLHWELVFPAVLAAGGFDVLLANPPWEIEKPSSQEFFSSIDPDFRALSKSAATARQRVLLQDDTVHARWQALLDDTQHLQGFIRNCARGVDDAWPYRHQGHADGNRYKRFVELCVSLTRVGGRFGFLVPAGLYSDEGCTKLRALLWDHCTLERVVGVENRAGLFAIHKSFKFTATVGTRGGRTEDLHARFMERDLRAIDDDDGALTLSRATRTRLAPRTHALLELSHARDLEVLTRMQTGTRSLDDSDVQIRSEWHMASDARSFIARDLAEAEGHVASEHGLWLRAPFRPLAHFGLDASRTDIEARPAGVVLARDGLHAVHIDDVKAVCVPLVQGVSFQDGVPDVAGYVSGANHRARWEPHDDVTGALPQFLLRASDARARGLHCGAKLGVRTLSNATNARTLVSCLLDDVPCGNSIGTLVSSSNNKSSTLWLAACMGSLPLDWALRLRLAGTNVNGFVLRESVGVPAVPPAAVLRDVEECVLGLAAPGVAQARLLRALRPGVDVRALRSPRARAQARAFMGAHVVRALGLTVDDVRWIVRDCDHPVTALATRTHTRTLEPKGFWRVDRTLPPELRAPVLWLAACVALERSAASSSGTSWALPESLCLRDLGLGHDARAHVAQPVRGALSDAGDVVHRARAVELHAELIDALLAPSP
jgi:hypothetical protein